MKKFKLRGEVWVWPTEKAAWHFVYVNEKASESIRKIVEGKKRRGFGAVAVTVTIGKTSWKTSIFPDKKSGTYILPLKAGVRKKEDIREGETISFTLDVKE